MAQAIEDGYLAACEIQKGRVNIDDTGITGEQILEWHPIDAVTGRALTAADIDELYAEWCAKGGRERAEYYAFKCTAASSGNDQLPDLRASTRSHFITTTGGLEALRQAGDPKAILQETKARMFAA
jgi:hypothetical protein